MTDPTRDEIAQILRTARADQATHHPEVFHDPELQSYADADALLTAGLLVPAGLTADAPEEMRAMAKQMDDDTGNGWGDWPDMMRAWADALELRETPE